MRQGRLAPGLVGVGLSEIPWQVDRDHRAIAHLRVDAHLPARLPGEPIEHRQAEPIGLVVKKGSNARSMTSFGIPAPLSETHIKRTGRAAERVVKQHVGIELFEVVAEDAREAERGRQEAGGLGCERRSTAISPPRRR